MKPNDLTIQRIENARGHFDLFSKMWVERGSRADWDQLHSLHYKAEALPAGPQYFRCITDDGDLVGVVVFCPVSLLLSARHEVFPKLKPGRDSHFTNVHRARWLNENMTRAARIVTDTLYRGVGVSYRMVNLAMRLYGVRYVEIGSSMAKYNPFDAKAGFKHAHLRESRAYDAGLEFFRKHFEAHPADHQALVREFNALPRRLREALDREMRAFYYRHSPKEKTGAKLGNGTRRVDALPIPVLIREMQQLIFAMPLYGIWSNPDVGRTLPKRLRLDIFDRQKPDEPLILTEDDYAT